MIELIPSVPFIWPEARVLKELLVYAGPAPYQSLIESAGSMSGIVYGIDDDGVRWLEEIFKKAASRSKLILVVYPACPTRCSALKKLLEIQHLLTDRISFRILPSDLESGAPSNILCFISSDDSSKVFFTTGPTPNFGLIKPGPGQANFVFRGDDVLLEAWRNWFNLAWNESAPLNTRTINIPALVPATGTVEAAEMWRTYLEQCQISMIQDTSGEARTEIEIDQETGEVFYKTEDGAKKRNTDR